MISFLRNESVVRSVQGEGKGGTINCPESSQRMIYLQMWLPCYVLSLDKDVK